MFALEWYGINCSVQNMLNEYWISYQSIDLNFIAFQPKNFSQMLKTVSSRQLWALRLRWTVSLKYSLMVSLLVVAQTYLTCLKTEALQNYCMKKKSPSINKQGPLSLTFYQIGSTLVNGSFLEHCYVPFNKLKHQSYGTISQIAITAFNNEYMYIWRWVMIRSYNPISLSIWL